SAAQTSTHHALPLLLPRLRVGAIVVDAERARALAQRVLQIDRTAVLLQQVSERLVGELLEGAHAVARIEIERREGCSVERHTFADRLAGSPRHHLPRYLAS